LTFWQVRVSDWNVDDERGSLPECTFDLHMAAVKGDELLSQSEAHSGSFEGTSFLVVRTVKVFKDAMYFVSRNSDASVLNREQHVVFIRRQAAAYGDFSGQGEFECVSNHIEDDFLPHLPINPNGDILSVHGHLEFDSAFFNCAAK
jgi:hypothetical protein